MATGRPLIDLTLSQMNTWLEILLRFKETFENGHWKKLIKSLLQLIDLTFDENQVVILGINTNGDSKDAVTKYLSKFPQKVRFPYLIDPVKSFYQDYLQRDMPTVLIIDKKGILKARSPSVGADQLVPYLKKLL